MQNLSNIVVDGLITFLYYRDLSKAAQFYEKIMEFELIKDQKKAKIYRVTGDAHLGIVDEQFGYHRASVAKPVMITVLVPDVDAWYDYLNKKGAKTLGEPKDTATYRHFMLEDPEGYVIEIQKFL